MAKRTKRRNTRRRVSKKNNKTKRRKTRRIRRKMRGGSGRVNPFKNRRGNRLRQGLDPDKTDPRLTTQAAAASQEPVIESDGPGYRSHVTNPNGSKHLVLSTNEYGFIEDIQHGIDKILFPGIESCNGIIVVLIDKKLMKENKIFGYHRPPHVGDISLANNDTNFLELINSNITNPDNFIFFVFSAGFDRIKEKLSEISSRIEEKNPGIMLLQDMNKSYKINDNPSGVKFKQILVETTTMSADWKEVISENTNCLVVFSPIKIFDYGWIINQGEKTAQIRVSSRTE